MFDPSEWGTVSDWVLGIVFGLGTVVLAGAAAYWSRRAAKAEERNVALMAHSQRADFSLTCGLIPHLDQDSGHYLMRLSLSKDSVPVWIRQVEISASYGALPDLFANMQVWFEDLKSNVFPYKEDGIFLSPGKSIERMWTAEESFEGKYPLDYTDSWNAIGSVRYTLAVDDPEDLIHTRVIDMEILQPPEIH